MNIKAVLTAAMVVLLSACNATLPVNSDTAGAVLVVPTEISKHPNAEYLKSFWLDFEPIGEGEPFRVVVNPEEGKQMQLETDIKPGYYRLATFHVRARSAKGWDTTRLNQAFAVNIPLEIADNAVTVWDYTMVYTITKKDGRTYTEHYDIKPLDNRLRADIKTRLGQMNADGAWNIIYLGE